MKGTQTPTVYQVTGTSPDGHLFSCRHGDSPLVLADDMAVRLLGKNAVMVRDDVSGDDVHFRYRAGNETVDIVATPSDLKASDPATRLRLSLELYPGEEDLHDEPPGEC